MKDDSADAHEERNMWSQIVTDLKRLRTTHARATEVGKLQVELETKLANGKFLCHMISSACCPITWLWHGFS